MISGIYRLRPAPEPHEPPEVIPVTERELTPEFIELREMHRRRTRGAKMEGPNGEAYTPRAPYTPRVRAPKEPKPPRVRAPKEPKAPRVRTPKAPKAPRVYNARGYLQMNKAGHLHAMLRGKNVGSYATEEAARAALAAVLAGKPAPPGITRTGASGIPGISFLKKTGSYHAWVRHDGKRVFIVSSVQSAIDCCEKMNAIFRERGGDWLEHIVEIPGAAAPGAKGGQRE